MATATLEPQVDGKKEKKRLPPVGNYGTVHDSKEAAEADPVENATGENQFAVWEFQRRDKPAVYCWARNKFEAAFVAWISPNLVEYDDKGVATQETANRGFVQLRRADERTRGPSKKLTELDIKLINSLRGKIDKGASADDIAKWEKLLPALIPYFRIENRVEIPEQKVSDEVLALLS